MAESLLEAVYDQDPEAVKAMLRAGRSPDELDKYRRTPLFAAVLGPEPEEMVKLLLAAGADPNLESEGTHEYATDGTPLSAAATWGRTEIVRVLLAHGADPNLVSHDQPPLVDAARGGHEGTVKLLLDAGADPNLGAPLVHAAERGSVSVVRLLLDSGAEPGATDRWPNRALGSRGMDRQGRRVDTSVGGGKVEAGGCADR